MKKNQLNKEEEILRDKLNEVEFDFQPGDWTALEKQLPSSSGNASWFSGKAAIGAAIVVSLTAAWFIVQDEESQKTSRQEFNKEVQVDPAEETVPEIVTSEKAESVTQEVEIEPRAEAKQEIAAVDEESPDSKEEIKFEDAESTPSVSNEISDNPPQTTEKSEPVPDEESDKSLAEDNQSEFPEAKINGLNSPEKVCEGAEYTIELDMENELPEGYTIDWYVGAGKLLAKDSRISGMSLKDNGMNQFKIVVKDPNGEVFRSYERSVETVYLPELDFTYDDLKDPYQDYSAEVKVDPDLYQSYQWFDDNDKLLAEGEDALLEFKNKGIHDVRLKATSQEGCISTLDKPLSIAENFDPMAPNAFSPLNQDKLNNTFMPEAFKSRDDDQFSMQIMTLDGKLLYETNNVLEEWNGKKNNSGQMMPAGLYVWKVMIRNQAGKSRTFVGNLRILHK